MNLRVNISRIFIIFIPQFVINVALVKQETKDLLNIIYFINVNSKINLNLIINPPKDIENDAAIWRSADNSDITKLIVNNITSNALDLKPVYGNHNSEILTVIWFSKSEIIEMFELLKRLLYKIHYKDILLVHREKFSEKSELDKNLLMLIFQKCWSSGFVSVLLWSEEQLYTYHPYPNIKVVYLENVDQFMDKSHLRNFQQYTWRAIFVDFPNQCYSYINRKGELMRTGYFYKWMKLFVEYYNGTMEYIPGDMWSGNGDMSDALKAILKANITIIPIYLRNSHQLFDVSDVMHLTRVTLMVPNSKEVSRSLYPLLPLSGFIWLIIVWTGIMIFIVIYFLQRTKNTVTDLSKLALESFCVLLFISCGLERKTIKDFLLHLLFLFTGIFLTTYYSTSLSSYLTSREYEPPLRYLNDIARTDLTLLEYSGDVAFMLEIDIPNMIKERLRWGNNSLLFQNRKKLNMTYMYSMHEEFLDYMLFQQYYLKHPVARKLDQEMYYRPMYVSLPHGTPFIDQLNKFLLRIRENGLFDKCLTDAKWDGVVSGNIKIMLDPDEKQPLGMEYLYYVFLIWICGLFLAFVVFILECVFKNLKCHRNLKKFIDI
ncbi:uncharacterized protein ACRADG_001732 [Cochliomyia hominivorax]